MLRLSGIEEAGDSQLEIMSLDPRVVYRITIL